MTKNNFKLCGKYVLMGLTSFLFACQSTEELKTEQYFAEGYQLYTKNCSNCHQPTGLGMANLYPPVANGSLSKDKAKVACIIKNGIKDTIVVDGKNFSRPMPANPMLTDLEIAEIISYIGLKWQKDTLYTSIDFVNRSLQECK